MMMFPKHEAVTIGITNSKDILEATPEMEGETMSKRVIELIYCGLKWRKSLGWNRSVSTARGMKKADLVELVEGLIAHGEISLCRIEMPGPVEPSEQVLRLTALLEAYKKKVDELILPGEIFVPNLVEHGHQTSTESDRKS